MPPWYSSLYLAPQIPIKQIITSRHLRPGQTTDIILSSDFILAKIRFLIQPGSFFGSWFLSGQVLLTLELQLPGSSKKRGANWSDPHFPPSIPQNWFIAFWSIHSHCSEMDFEKLKKHFLPADSRTIECLLWVEKETQKPYFSFYLDGLYVYSSSIYSQMQLLAQRCCWNLTEISLWGMIWNK